MSVNIVQNGTLIPIAGKTVPMPTPDYVDIQYTPSASWTKGQTCISGNKRYRCKVNNTGSAYAPPNATYWEELSVASELNTHISITLLGSANSQTISDASVKSAHIANLPDITQYDYILAVLSFTNKGVMGSVLIPQNDIYRWGESNPSMFVTSNDSNYYLRSASLYFRSKNEVVLYLYRGTTTTTFTYILKIYGIK